MIDRCGDPIVIERPLTRVLLRAQRSHGRCLDDGDREFEAAAVHI